MSAQVRSELATGAGETVSVVIPLYNHAAFLRAAVESVLRQSRPPEEIIVIDDGSTDRSPQIAESLARAHPSIRFWSRENRGAHATINEGVRASTGSLVAILNSDDLFHRERIARALAAFEIEPAAAAFASGLSFIDGRGASIGNAWFDEALAFHRKTGDLGVSLVNANFVMTTSNLVVRRGLFDALGGFADFRYAHDLDFLLRAVAAKKRILIAPRPLVSYRMHGNNTISESHRKVKAEWALAAALYAWRLGRADASASPPAVARKDAAAQARPGAGAQLRPDAAAHESGARQKLQPIFERHGLSRLVALALSRLQDARAEGDADALLADAAFRAQLVEAVS